VGSGGIVRDEAVHTRVMLGVAEAAAALGFRVRAVCRSRIDGVGGNREFFMHLVVPGHAPRSRRDGHQSPLT
jgi:23S rRNA (cytidine1920-2'-O)/16S rRNA (cytidine1409-2'-O)-methyltransferase